MDNNEAVTYITKLAFDIYNANGDVKTVNALLQAKDALSFKDYFDSLYGTGLEIVGWHLNGATEPFDNFYESALMNNETT